MRIASLGSGSRGNATLVSVGTTNILIDCGFSIRETERRLLRLSLSLEQLTAIVVTHEHSDHINGVERIARKAGKPVWMSYGTAQYFADIQTFARNIIDIHQPFEINDIQISPFPVPHDAQEPCQFVFSDGNKRTGLLTDTGCITPFIVEQLNGCNALLLESNHDVEMLADSEYPASLKQRVGGDYGHLNNGQAAELLAKMDCSQLQYLAAMHLSEKNNDPALVRSVISNELDCDFDWIQIADQEQGLPWYHVN